MRCSPVPVTLEALGKRFRLALGFLIFENLECLNHAWIIIEQVLGMSRGKTKNHRGPSISGRCFECHQEMNQRQLH